MECMASCVFPASGKTLALIVRYPAWITVSFVRVFLYKIRLRLYIYRMARKYGGCRKGKPGRCRKNAVSKKRANRVLKDVDASFWDLRDAAQNLAYMAR